MTKAGYQILLSLVDGPSHGYAIMQQTEDRTLANVTLGPATLYRSRVFGALACARAGGGAESRDVKLNTPVACFRCGGHLFSTGES